MLKSIHQTFSGIAATDGAGVELTRVIGQPQLNMLDPFLLLDAFRSSNPDDYIAGFPQHPHRGFETVTYMLNGKMRHKDNAGNEGVIEPGGIQWMTAGKGILHSEMPEQEDGLLEGFQLWVNLPASHKMTKPKYQEYPSKDIPIEFRDGVTLKVIAGTSSQGTKGPITQILTESLYFDVSIQANKTFKEALPKGHNTFIYVIEGNIKIQDKTGLLQVISKDQISILSEGTKIEISTGDKGGRLLLISGKPLNEPVARRGPFVMNTQEEIKQAFDDYNAGLF